MNAKAVRKKQPQATRRQLLDVVGEIILEKGLQAVTLDAVSEAAGVSKGGLLYHFPSKKAILEAFVEDGSNSFTASVEKVSSADPVSTGRSTRAELRTIADSQDIHSACLWTALLATRHENGGFHERLREHFYKIMKSDSPDSIEVSLAIVYLAADGLALADIAGIFDQNRDLRSRIVKGLEFMTRNPSIVPDQHDE